MEINLNGKTCALPDDLTAAGLIDHLDLTGQRLAMEVNGEIVPRSEQAVHVLQAGDKIEIVRAIGGG